MKNDNGEEWRRQDYVLAIVCVILMLIAIILPATLWATSIYVVGNYVSEDTLQTYIFVSIIVLMCLWLVGMIWYQLRRDKRTREFEMGLRNWQTK